MILPVSYRAAPEMLTAAIDLAATSGAPFDLIWMLGVAVRSSAWRVEQFGRNQNGAGADAEGHRPGRNIAPGGPDKLEATVPVDEIAKELTGSAVPAIVSHSAGDYLCNHVFYTALLRLRELDSKTAAGFLHVPPDQETLASGRTDGNRFTFEDHIRAVELTLRVLAGQIDRS
jgi:pyroglutamyl-peptidase